MTVGSEAIKLLQKGDEKQGVIDTQREMQKGYIDDLIKCAKRYKDWTELFYICVQTRRERLLSNVVRNQFYGRLTRPTPEYDLALYSYDPKTENLKFEWVVPDKETVEQIVAMDKLGIVDPEIDPDLWKYCLQFHSRTLR